MALVRLTILALSASNGSSAWVRKNGPLRWTLHRPSNCASLTLARGLNRPYPALLTKPARVVACQDSRKASTTDSRNAGKLATSATSSFSATALPPAFSMRPVTAAAAWGLVL